MNKEKILIIEDNKNILDLVKYNLEQAGYRVSGSLRGDLGLDVALKEMPDLLVLDLMLPGIDGIEICKTLRQNDKTSTLPILILTAKTGETDRILGLELGADDYMTKPFSPRELVARVKTLLRRASYQETIKTLKVGHMEMDVERHIVTLRKKQLELTYKEYNLLKVLLEARGRVLGRDHLLNRVWGYDQSMKIETRRVDMHIGSLRKKLRDESRRLLTVKGEGYRFNAES